MVRIVPSLLAGNFACLGEEVRVLDGTDCDGIHLDVMDGHFVPNLTFGVGMIRSLRPYTGKVFDTHLMIEGVDYCVGDYVGAGSDSVTVHVEGVRHLDSVLGVIRSGGCMAGVALNPATLPGVVEYVLDRVDIILVMGVNPGYSGQVFLRSQLEKIRILRGMIGDRRIDLVVDGGVDVKSAGEIVMAGATTLVAGQSIFETGDYAENIRVLRNVS